MRPSRRQQLTDFQAAEALASAAALHQEYRRQCLIPLHEQVVLRSLGLARSVKLPKAAFTIPPPGVRDHDRHGGSMRGGDASESLPSASDRFGDQ